ncbi:UDP-N-acetylglucosamine 4,6-dehydratase (inverting) [Candidatus Pelagibacter sp.]|nr:UDP-N-acetylglucosamine 4,6-dehydratase (inverting) [Candidatus Pelagibacter sp.]
MINRKIFQNKSILITGATGSFGNALIDYFLKKKINLKKIVIYSRDELKQYQVQERLKNQDHSKLRYFLGDVRDKDRLRLALDGIDFVVHAAALKQVPAAEYNPFEFIKTNIMGAQNIIECCLQSKVKRIVALSTDKASSPVNLYGATKLCSDKLFTSAQNISGKRDIKFSVVRYGNVFGSRGSVFPRFMSLAKSEPFPVTDPNMTRFNISLSQSVEFVLNSLSNQKGGEIFVPKLKSFRIIDLCKSIDSKRKIKIIGIRPGEKIHEELISKVESSETIDCGDYYVILPHKFTDTKNTYRNIKNKYVSKNFHYTSEINKDYLSINELSKIVQEM